MIAGRRSAGLAALWVLGARCATAAATSPAAPGGTLFTTAPGAPGGAGGLRIEQGRPPAEPRPNLRLAYGIELDPQGRPVVQAYAFLLGYVAFSRLGGVYPWPALCEFQWGWNPLARRLEPQRSSGLLRAPECAVRGTVQVTGFLSPRIDVRPAVTVTVEGPRETLELPARVVLHDPKRVSWSGVPVVQAELPSARLEDGRHRLRFAGGFREVGIDGDPGTSLFEDGGDATVEFLVHNRPPRLVSLAAFSGSATLYRGAWRREGPEGATRLVLDRSGAGTPPAGESVVVALEFTVPVTRVRVELRGPGGARRTARIARTDGDDQPVASWRGMLPWPDRRTGEWTFRVTAETPAGVALEPLAGTAVPEVALGRLEPETGACAECRTGPDTAHRLPPAVP